MMKKIFGILAAVTVLSVVLVGCQQNTSPASDSASASALSAAGSSSRQISVPINLLAAATTTGSPPPFKRVFMPPAIRQEIEVLQNKILTVKNTETAPSGKDNTPESVGVEHIVKDSFIDWEVYIAKKEAEVFAGANLAVHHTTNLKAKYDSTNKEIVYDLSTATDKFNTNALKINKAEIEKHIGRDLHVGDTVYFGFVCKNDKGKECGRISYSILVTAPEELSDAEIFYTFEKTKDGKPMYAVKVAVDGEYPTLHADIYAGNDKKAEKLNKDKLIAYVDVNLTPKKTYFHCTVPAEKIVLDKPYHIRATLHDLEYGGDETETSFKFNDVIYATQPDDTWGFSITNAGKTFYLSEARGAVAVNTADPTLEWKKSAIKKAAALWDSTHVTNEIYEIAVKESGKEKPAYFFKPQSTNDKAMLKGLKYNTEYEVQVTYRYDLKDVYSVITKEEKSPVVKFKTPDFINTSGHITYTFDNGRLFGTDLVDNAAPTKLSAPAGIVVNEGGNPSNALQLRNNSTITSNAQMYYKAAKLTFDVRHDFDMLAVPALYTSSSGANFTFRDKKENLNTDLSLAKDIWTFENGDVSARLVYVPPVYVSDQEDYTNSGNWTLQEGKVLLLVQGNKNSSKPVDYKFSETSAYTSTVLFDKKPADGYLTNKTVSEVVTALAALGVNPTVAIKNPTPWRTVMPTAVIAVSNDEISVKVDGFGEAKTAVTAIDEKLHGYKSFTFTSKQNNLLIDNLTYEVTDSTYSRSVR